MNLIDDLRELLNSRSEKEETELTTDIQSKKPENLRLEETRYTPIEEA